MTENKGILVYAQLNREKELENVVFELANAGNELSKKLNDEPVQAVLITGLQDVSKLKETLKNNGFDKVYLIQNERLEKYSTDLYVKVFVDLVQEIKPSIVLFGATTQGRDLASAVSSRLNTGLTADCVKLDINEKGQLASTRPTFGGHLMATILCKTYPQMATVRPKVLKMTEAPIVKDTEFVEFNANIDNVVDRVELVEFIKRKEITGTRLDEAEIVVAGGKGVKTESGFNLLKKLAIVLGGSVAASRGAVEMGLADSSIQIGQTGKTIVPKIYIAVGISGAVQHLVGMNGSDKIIAINTDENAPIFNIADVGIVGDFNEILPELINRLKG